MISCKMTTKILCANFEKRSDSRMRKNGYKEDQALPPEKFFHVYIIIDKTVIIQFFLFYILLITQGLRFPCND